MLIECLSVGALVKALNADRLKSHRGAFMLVCLSAYAARGLVNRTINR